MFHKLARQVNDFETHAYATTEHFLFSSNLLLNSKVTQEITIFFLDFSSFSSFYFFYFFFVFFVFLFLDTSIPFFCFWFSFFLWYNYNKSKIHFHTSLFGIPRDFPSIKRTRSHYRRLANKMKQG